MAAQDKPDSKKSSTTSADAGGGAVWKAVRNALDHVSDRLEPPTKLSPPTTPNEPDYDIPAARLLETWLREDASIGSDGSWAILKAALDADRPTDGKLFP